MHTPANVPKGYTWHLTGLIRNKYSNCHSSYYKKFFKFKKNRVPPHLIVRNSSVYLHLR